VFVVIRLIIYEPTCALYPVWIRCCKRPNYDSCISQSSV